MSVATKIIDYSHMWIPMTPNIFDRPLGLGRNGRMELYFVIKMFARILFEDLVLKHTFHYITGKSLSEAPIFAEHEENM